MGSKSISGGFSFSTTLNSSHDHRAVAFCLIVYRYITSLYRSILLIHPVETIERERERERERTYLCGAEGANQDGLYNESVGASVVLLRVGTRAVVCLVLHFLSNPYPFRLDKKTRKPIYKR